MIFVATFYPFVTTTYQNQCCVFKAQEKKGSKLVFRMSRARSRSRSDRRRPDGDLIQMVLLTTEAEARLDIVVDALFCARVELAPEHPERQEARSSRSSAEELDRKIGEWSSSLLSAESIVRRVKAELCAFKNQVLVEHFGVPGGIN